MKIRALLLALALVVVALPASAAGPNDKVTGAGTVLPTTAGSSLQFSLQAKSDADGSHAKGNLNYRRINGGTAAPNYKIKVTGLCVVGNRASIVGRFIGAPPFGPSFPTAFVLVQDNGSPKNGTRDLALVTAFSGVAPDPCALFGFAGFMRPLVRGNISVRDAT